MNAICFNEHLTTVHHVFYYTYKMQSISVLLNINFFAETIMLTDDEKTTQQTHGTPHNIMNDTMYYKPTDYERYIFNPEIQSVLKSLYGEHYQLFNDPLNLNQ